MTSSAEGRRARALELHLAGANYDKIAEMVGYASKGSAHKAVQEALNSEAPSPNSAEELQTELARLDALLAGLWQRARRGEVQAVDRVLKIGERRAALLTLDTAGSSGPAEGTGLSEFERRLRDREQGSAAARGAQSG